MKYLLMLLFGLLAAGPLLAEEVKPQEPEAVVEAFTFCLTHDNWAGARSLMDKRMFDITRSVEFFEREAKDRLPMLLSNKGASFVDHGTTVTGDDAVVKAVVIANSLRVYGVTFILRKEGGLWKLDNIMYAALGVAKPMESV